MDYLDGLERERSVESGVKAIPEAKVARLVRPAGPSRPIAGLTFASVRTALEVGRADGPEELAADHLAARTVAALRAAAGAVQPEGLAAGRGALQSAPLVAQRRATAAPSADVAGGGPATASVQSLVGNASQTGRPLERGVRSSFEAAMGADFGAVRVHTGPAVAAGSASIAAKAFTVGSDIFFRDGLPDTAGAAGQHLMAHELAHTLERPGGTVGRLRRTPDATGEEITVERINDPGTTKATLEAWADLLEWDDEACADAIEVRLAEFALQESDAAERVAAQSLLDKAKAAADEKDEAERATSAASALRHKTVADLVGGSLPNYVETIDGALKVALKDGRGLDQMVASFFVAAAAVEGSKSAQAVFDALSGDQVALEAFIMCNAGLGPTAKVPTSIADANQVSTVWKALADYSAVPAAMTALCAQIAAGRIVPIYTLYRAATITSTAGSYYRFHRIETKRAIAGSELHLHPGKKNDLNNAGFKPSGGGKGEARREPVKPGDYQKIKVAMGASWRAD